jgi:hypothetical protein
MKYNNTHKITKTILNITTTIQINTNQQHLPQDHLRLATIHTRKIRILPIEQKVIIQSKAENPKQFLIIVYFAVINSHPASFMNDREFSDNEIFQNSGKGIPLFMIGHKNWKGIYE